MIAPPPLPHWDVQPAVIYLAGNNQVGDCTTVAALNTISRLYPTDPALPATDAEATPEAESLYYALGGTATSGIAPETVFTYWETHPLWGTELVSAPSIATNEISIKQALLSHHALYVQLWQDQTWGMLGDLLIDSGPRQWATHAAVIEGWTPQTVIIATWGQRLFMDWGQFETNVMHVWAPTVTGAVSDTP